MEKVALLLDGGQFISNEHKDQIELTNKSPSPKNDILLVRAGLDVAIKYIGEVYLQGLLKKQ